MTTYHIKKYGIHELHNASCVWLPIRKGMIELGDFNSDEDALKEAQKRFEKIEPCPTCCKAGKRKGIPKATH